MTLFRYNLFRFIHMFARVAFISLCALLIIGMVDELGGLKEDQGIDRAAYLSILGQLENFYSIIPLMVLIASISLFTAMSRSSEIIAIRAAGQSGLRFLIAPCLGAFIVGVFALLLLNPLVTVSATQYSIEKGRAQPSAVLTLGAKGIWMRQGDSREQTIIFARSLDAQKLTISNVTFMAFNETGTPISRIEAGRAELIGQEWVLHSAKKWDLRDENPQLGMSTLRDGTRIETQITPKDISSGFGKPNSVPIYALPAYINSLESAGFSAVPFRVWFQSELAKPLALIVMVLIAAGFTMRHIRSGNRAQMVIFATLLGFALFFLRNIAQVFGQNGYLPVELASWGPLVAASLLAVTLLLHLEEG